MTKKKDKQKNALAQDAVGFDDNWFILQTLVEIKQDLKDQREVFMEHLGKEQEAHESIIMNVHDIAIRVSALSEQVKRNSHNWGMVATIITACIATIAANIALAKIL